MPVTKHRFEWLRDYLDYEDEIRYLQWKIRKAKREEWRWASGDLAKLRLEGESHGSHVMDEVPEYQSALDKCEQQRSELLELVGSFQGYENDILRLKYIEGMTLEEIAEELPYSYDSIKRKHAELHRRLDYLDEFEQRKRDFEDRLDSDARIISQEFS